MVLLDGGNGTELGRRGCDTRLPLWGTAALLDRPEIVRRVHAAYLEAGARVITTNTFRLNPRSAAEAGLDHDELVAIAVLLVREAIDEAEGGDGVLVAGSVGPLEDCYRPDLVPDDGRLREEHASRIAALASADADLVLIETMNTVREANAALEAARGRLPAAVSFVCAEDGRLLSGEPLAEAVAAVEALEAEAILVNCCAPAAATEALGTLRAATERPVGAYANGRGRPDAVHGWRFEGGLDDEAYVQEAARWLERGARILGGCCGTTPETIRKLRALLD